MFLRKVDRAQVEPTVVFFHGGEFEREVAAIGVNTYVLTGGRMRNVGRTLKAARQLSLILRKEQPHYVLNWTSHTHIYGALAAWHVGMGERVVWWQRGVPGGESDTGPWIERLATLLPARFVICSSKATAAAQERMHPRRRTVVAYPGVEPLRTVGGMELRDLRKSLGIADGDRVIGIIGRLVPWKGQDRFLELLAELRAHGHGVHGLIVGGSTVNIGRGFEAKLHHLAERLGLSAHVTFTGQVADVGPYVQLLDVAVNLSHGEAFGLAIVEALSVGIPVVALDDGGPSEILAGGSAGVLVPPAHSELVFQAVEDLLTDEASRERMSVAARRAFEKNFTAQRLALDLAGIFVGDMSETSGCGHSAPPMTPVPDIAGRTRSEWRR